MDSRAAGKSGGPYDAIQMATAIHEGASFFLTNDARLPSLPKLKVLVLDELIPHQGRSGAM